MFHRRLGRFEWVFLPAVHHLKASFGPESPPWRGAPEAGTNWLEQREWLKGNEASVWFSSEDSPRK